MTSEGYHSEGRCPECGHERRIHPRPDGTGLGICAACIWEEDEGLRRADEMCKRAFPSLVPDELS